ncbi:MAG: hypothetical protein KDE22_03245 [Rhodobacterales bacterium]|nr:hypothetical protein [Rhodobacterales bacterium]
MAKQNGKHSIQPGDNFVRLGQTNTLWEVIDVLSLREMPPHVRLRAVGGHRVLTFAISAVLDRRLFQRTERAPEIVPEVMHEAQPVMEDVAPAAPRRRMGGLFGLGESAAAAN